MALTLTACVRVNRDSLLGGFRISTNDVFHYSDGILNISYTLCQLDVLLRKFLQAFFAEHVEPDKLMTVKIAMAGFEFLDKFADFFKSVLKGL